MPRKPISFELDFMIKDIFPRFTVKQFDDVSFNIKPKNQGLDYDITGTTGKIFVGVNNDMFMQTDGITVSSNNINVLLDKNMLQKNGRAYAEIELTDSAGTITSSSFIFDIDPKIGEGGQIPGEYEGFVEKYERLISEFKSQVSSTINNCNDKVNITINNCNTNVDNKLNSVDSLVNVKISDFEKRFNRLTSSQQQSAEIIDARDGETSLKARLDRDIEKAKQVYVNVEGSYISTDSSSGYLKDVEIFGNTVQDTSNLADIRSVGDKVEGQELYEIPVLSRGKNLFDGVIIDKALDADTGNLFDNADWFTTNYIMVNSDKITFSTNTSASEINSLNFTIVMYDTNYKFIGNVGFYNNNSGTWTLIPNTKYIRVRLPRANYSNIQIEEGTVATPYEPYVEEKLTILSPVQLEKVGDVADRVIEKDGVWGVEKNVDTVVLNGSENWLRYYNGQRYVNCYYVVIPNVKEVFIISNKFKYGENAWDNESEDCMSGHISGAIYVAKQDIASESDFKQWLQANPTTVKYVTTQPQFIPLPHDQQVKLRTFANKTNISFLTEIEGTIKAQVPKSLGATVNTHTEQINNLNKELDRVKKLEESTVSTVTTESDFTTVEATNNGYFEDVKLEGKTLVNLYATTSTSYDGTTINGINTLSNMTLGKLCTVICKAGKPFGVAIYKNNIYKETLSISQTTKLIQLANDEEIKVLEGKSTNGWDCTSNGESVFKKAFIILEGDHTQNPPSYFEGLKSVGQSATTSEDGVDEISVESCYNVANIATEGNTNFQVANIKRGITYSLSIKRSKGHGYNLILQDKVGNSIKKLVSNSYQNFNTFVSDVDGILYFNSHDTMDVSEIMLLPSLYTEDTMPKFKPYSPDKKRLLYYNNETQAWEKPILREWDSIEKHADGKYYYHQRSGEVVLNGSETWIARNMSNENNTIGFGLSGGLPNYNINSMPPTICDRFTYMHWDALWVTDEESMTHAGDYFHIRILKSKLSTQDVAGLKQWLRANPVTVVYQLAQEKVYECTNIDLITYANETNYVVESGAIVPKTTLKVHNNISNVVSLLQKKVSLLESNVTKYMITQNRLMLASRYNADTVSFKVDVASFSDTFEYDNDLYELILNNILVGKDNYNREYIENLIIFYWMDFIISDEMYLTLFEIIEEQHNPKVIEDEAPIE